jgi:signal transduction histidine kinase
MYLEVIVAMLLTFLVSIIAIWYFVTSQVRYILRKTHNLGNDDFEFTNQKVTCPLMSDLSLELDKLHHKLIANDSKLEYMQTIFDSNYTITIVCDEHGNVSDANHSFFKFFKYQNLAEFSLHHSNIADFFEDVRDIDYVNKIDFNNWTEIVSKEQKKVLIVRNGKNNFFNIKAKLFKKDEHSGLKQYIVSLANITEIEGYKIELNILNQSLEDKVSSKTRELRSLNEKLQETIDVEVEKNRQKDKTLIQQSRLAAMGEMIGNIAHQWRQPLSAISSIASGNQMQLEFGDLDEKEMIEGYEKIFNYTEFLSQTIDDFRDFFREDKAKELFFIDDIITKVLNLVRSSLKYYDIDIQTHSNNENIKFYGYPNELSQVMLNIISNAKDILKDSDNDRHIHLEIGLENNVITIDVYDNGGGVPDDIIEKVFEPYFTTKHQSQGTGIGLYMSKEIIEKHMQGELCVENSKFEINGIDGTHQEYGAKFTIKLFITEEIKKYL